MYHSSRPVVGIARAADLPLGGSSSRSLYRAAVPAVRNHRNAHGAELNAFLEEPGRSVALAASKARAEKGQAVVRAHGGAVVANATDTGESVAMVTTALQPSTGFANVPRLVQPAPRRRKTRCSQAPAVPQPTLVVGLVGLVVAAFLLREAIVNPGPANSRSK